MRKSYCRKSGLKLKTHPYNRRSSSAKPDQLSYSYSCIEAFKENQNLLNNLITFKPDPKYKTVKEDPLLFSLSGERERPIYHPFYYSYSKSEYLGAGQNGCLSESDNFYESRKNILVLDKNETDSRDEEDSEKLYFDSNILLQWIKYQFKYVNDLWPFLKSKDYFIPNLCKKSKDIKMEMLLNNIDEQSKYSLKRYVEDLQLNIEEKCSIRNESVIEIDITPIMGDKQQLQEFLEFLQNIESASNNENLRPEDNRPKIPLKSKISILTAHYKGDGPFIGNSRFNPRQNKPSQGLTPIQRRKFKQDMDFKGGSILEHTRNINLNLLRNSEFGSNLETLRPSRKNELSHSKDLIKCPTTETPEEKFKGGASKNNLLKKKKVITFGGYEEKELLKKTSSYKCLMHKCREDYKRYKNQCLFGKGDEKSNNVIGFVHLKENKSRLKLPKCLSNISFKFTESTKVPPQREVYKNKYYLREKNKDKSSDSDLTDVCFHNYESIRAEDSEEVIGKIDFQDSSVETESQTNKLPTYKKTAKDNSVNACFESLNYSFNSVSWTTISDPFADSLTLSPDTSSSTRNQLLTAEDLSSKQYSPLNETKQILKETQYSNKKTNYTGRKTPVYWEENVIVGKCAKHATCPNKVGNNKERTLEEVEEKQSNRFRFVDDNSTYKSLGTKLHSPKRERIASDQLKGPERQTDIQPEPSKQNSRYSKLNVLKPKHLYKSISAMMKGNNTNKRKTTKGQTDGSTIESNDTDYTEKQQRIPMTGAQQREITALIIENFEKVYKELKQQNSEITNLKKILYDRIYDD